MENFKEKSLINFINAGTLKLQLDDFEKYIVDKIKNNEI